MTDRTDKYSLRESPPLILEPPYSAQLRMNSRWLIFGSEAGVFVFMKLIKKRYQVVNNMAGRKKYSLEEAVDLILRADSDSGSEPELSCSKRRS